MRILLVYCADRLLIKLNFSVNFKYISLIVRNESRRIFAAPIKLSQKERKRLSSESEKQGEITQMAVSPPTKPVRTWATLPPLGICTELVL